MTYMVAICVHCERQTFDDGTPCTCGHYGSRSIEVVPSGTVTDEMIEAGSEALYEMSRGESWPGRVHGLQCRHVGTRVVSETVLRAALGRNPTG